MKSGPLLASILNILVLIIFDKKVILALRRDKSIINDELF